MAFDYEGQNKLNAEKFGATSIGAVNHIVGDTVTLLTKPNDEAILVLDVEVGDFRVRVGDFTAVGADVVVNGDFAADTDWTKGTGWTIAADIASSDASQSADSDLEQTLVAGSLIEGESYDTSFTVSGRTAGNATVVVGGTEGTDRATDATHTETIVAGASQVIAIRADLAFDGDIDDFTVERSALSFTATPAATTGGIGSLLIRTNVENSAFYMTAPDQITVVGDGSSDILTFYWL